MQEDADSRHNAASSSDPRPSRNSVAAEMFRHMCATRQLFLPFATRLCPSYKAALFEQDTLSVSRLLFCCGRRGLCQGVVGQLQRRVLMQGRLDRWNHWEGTSQKGAVRRLLLGRFAHWLHEAGRGSETRGHRVFCDIVLQSFFFLSVSTEAQRVC